MSKKRATQTLVLKNNKSKKPQTITEVNQIVSEFHTLKRRAQKKFGIKFFRRLCEGVL